MRLLILAQMRKARLHPAAFSALFLLLVSLLAYGLLIPWLHLYIDDLIWFWTWHRLGPQGIENYFATNRPIWGLLYQATLPLFTQSILGSHIFALLVRWASSLACWWLLRLLWPGRPRVALYGALIFLVYPGFALQPIALTYAQIFLIYTVFLLSLCFHVLALRSPRHSRALIAAAWLLSLLNLATLEYFFTLELARPVLLAVALAERESNPRRLAAAVLRSWLPFLALFAAAAIWRTFFFAYQTFNHPLKLLELAKTQPVSALAQLAGTMLQDLFDTSLGAWLPALTRLASLNVRQANGVLTLALTGAALALIAALLHYAPADAPTGEQQPRRAAAQLAAVGLVLLLAAGWPFWLTMLEVQPVEFLSRMTLPFMLGTVLLLTGLLEWIPWQHARTALLAAAAAAACGYHLQVANDFRLDWDQNQQMMWQISWRIPDLKEGTALLISDFPVTYYNTAALSTQINAIYPHPENGPILNYYLFYSRELDRDLEGGLIPGQPIKGSNVSAAFHGSTSQVLAAQFDSSRCFRLLDPELDPYDETQHEHLRRAAQISSLAWVRADQPPSQPPQRLFGEPPAGQWCYYFEKADLARQQQNWQEAARLWDEAQTAGLHPRDAVEKLVFIEAFAHTGQWQRAVEISSGFENAEKRPMLCRLWERIDASTPESAEKASAFRSLDQSGSCPIKNSAR